MTMSMDYAQIAEGCRRRDPKAQRALYYAAAGMCMGICMRYAEGRDEAQDMMQEGFIKVFERIGTLKNAEVLMAWVRGVMVNSCIDWQRSRRRWQPMDEVEEPEDFAADPYAMEEIVAAMQQLTAMPRTVFNLCEVEGYTMNEAAKMLKTSKDAVKVALSRARQQLRQILTK